MAETTVCYSCKIFDVFNQKTQSFCEAFFNAVTPDLKSTLAYLVLIWFVWQLCQMMMHKNESLWVLFAQFLDLTMASVLLESFSWWKGIFFWFYDFGMEMGVRIIRITSEGAVSIRANGIETLLLYIEISFTPILDKVGIMMSDVSWTNLKISLAMIPVAVIYFLLLWRIFASLFSVFVQMFAITLLSPVLCCLFLLPPMKSAFFAALKIALSGGMQIMLSCGTIGIVLAYLNSLSMFTENDVSIGVGTVGYMQMLFTGALLWGAYGTIINTPSMLFNIGNASSGNDAMGYAVRQMQRISPMRLLEKK